MARRRKSLWILGVGLIPATLLVIYLSFDPNALRIALAEQVGAATGRTLSVGDLRLALTPHPTVVATDVTLGNPDWSSASDMLRVARLEGRLALRPLLSGRIIVRRITLTEAQLVLETDADGNGNWLFDEVASDSDDSSGWAPAIDTLEFVDLQLAWRDRPGGAEHRIAVDTLTVTGIGQEGPIAMVASASGDAATLAPSPWSLRFDFDTDDSGYRIDNIDGEWGSNDLRGNLRLLYEDGAMTLLGTLSSRSIDLPAWSADGNTGQAARVFSEAPVALHIPSGLRTGLSYRVERLTAPPFVFDKVAARIGTAEGVLALSGFEAQWQGAALSADLDVDTRGKSPRFALRLAGQRLPLARLLHLSGGQSWLDADGALDIEVTGSGRSLAPIMTSLDGDARLLIGPGKARLRDVDTMVGGLGAALATLVEEDTGQARLNCAAGSFSIRRGIATGELLLADTAHATVRGEGKIDLGAERLDLILRPVPKSVSINVAVPVRVGGTLADPTYTPEKFATARKGAGLLAALGAISFPPAIVLGLVDLGSGEDNPCLELAGAAPGVPATVKAAQRPSERDRNALERAGDDIGNAFGEIGDAIGGLFD